MRPKYKSTYTVSDTDKILPTFEHVLAYIRKHPDCMIIVTGKNYTTVLYRKGKATVTSRMSATRIKKLKSLFLITDFSKTRSSKYQERLSIKRFKTKWFSMSNLERLTYEQHVVNKKRRYQSEWGGIPSSVSTLAREFRDSLIQMGIKDPMNASS